LAQTLTLLDRLGAGRGYPDRAALFTCGQSGLAAPSVQVQGAVGLLLQGQAEAEKVWPIYHERGGKSGAEGLRRLLLAIIRDLRVVLILLARQLARMRAAATLAEDQRRALAQLSADIHAPLANRLGILAVEVGTGGSGLPLPAARNLPSHRWLAG
jgi:GTP pyrophosphokinase